jgi:flagellar biosynthesis anti-sigma factor FlgM
MRINGGDNPNARRTGRSGAAKGGQGTGGEGGGAGGLGEEAERLDLNLPKLRAKLDALPEVRTSRVDALRDAIDRGEYEVDGREVVGRVLRNVLLDNLK